MSKLLQEGLGWFRRSMSEHESVRESKSAPMTQQRSLDSPVPAKTTTAEDMAASDRQRSVSTGGPPPLIPPGSFPLADTLYDEQQDLLPELSDDSEVLESPADVSRLADALPPRLSGSPWSLVFSTSRDGFSLKNIYRKMERCEGPTLLVIEDTEGNRFGGLASDPFAVRESFFGTGESFLFSLGRRRDGEDNAGGDEEGAGFTKWAWTTANQLFVKCSLDNLVMGASEGHFGLFIDGDLNFGRSDRCETFGNELLSPKGDFTIKTLEVWTFH